MLSRSLLFSVLSLIAGLALPVVAQAPDCPSGPAIDGVYIAFADRVTRHELLSTGVTAEVEYAAQEGGQIFEYRTHPLGLYLESWEVLGGRMVAGAIETVTYTPPAVSMPQPRAGVTWSGREVSQYDDGMSLRYQTTVTVEASDVFPLGACDYVALPIMVDRTDEDTGERFRDAYVYLQDLGLVVYIGYGVPDEELTYDLPTGIGMRPPVTGEAPQTEPIEQPGK